MTQIKPLETLYKGYRFRSRLEARWAIFFDALREPWEYEPEGFNLGASPHAPWRAFGRKLGKYLPDFYLPFLGMYAEVKPSAPSPIEEDKCACLRDITGQPVLILQGPPARFWLDGNVDYDGQVLCWDTTDNGGGESDFPFIFSYCPHNGLTVVPINSRSDRTFMGNDGYEVNPRLCSLHAADLLEGRGIIKEAGAIARNSRFEHGESPHVWPVPGVKKERPLEFVRTSPSVYTETACYSPLPSDF